MRRPFAVEPFEKKAPFPRSWVEHSLVDLTDAEIYRRSMADPIGPGHRPTDGDSFLVKAAELGVNVGGLYRALYAQWAAQGGYNRPFDDCTWPQALEYAEKALPWGHEAERYAWAIRYMWCLELPELA